MKSLKTTLQLHIATLIVLIVYVGSVLANSNLSSNYPCQDTGKTCVSSGKRIVEGLELTRNCWEYSYTKSCNYPSKNDCGNYSHCYDLGTKECLLYDSLGNCVNAKKEFSCKSWEPEELENKTTRRDLVEKDGPESIVCGNIPCLDGNCVDKSYNSDGSMMDALSKLKIAALAGGDASYGIFQGNKEHCSKKPGGYSSCCGVGKGWGQNIGAHCSKAEIELSKKRGDKLCVYVGKTSSGKGPAQTRKHYFCCYGNLLEKAIAEQGRRQLGISFGEGEGASCRGLTIEEIEKLDFEKIDLTEFTTSLENEFAAKYKPVSGSDMKSRIESNFDIKEYKRPPSAEEAVSSGVHEDYLKSQHEEEQGNVEHEHIADIPAQKEEEVKKEQQIPVAPAKKEEDVGKLEKAAEKIEVKKDAPPKKSKFKLPSSVLRRKQTVTQDRVLQ